MKVSRNTDAPWRDEELLRQKYLHEDLTCDEIGEELGCSGHTVDKWRRKYGIEPLYKEKNWLHEKYNQEGLYISEISDLANCSRRTVTKWLDKLNVRKPEDRPADYADEKPWHDKERLKELYHGEDLSAKRVAEEMGCSPQTVRHWLIEFDIPRRPWYYRTAESEGQPQRPYPSVKDSYNGNKSEVLIHRLLCYAVGKIAFEELCDPNTVIHHRTNIPWDNRPENLQAMSRSEHMRLHAQSDYEPEVL